MTQAPLILASQSPARLGLLQSVDIVPDNVLPADIDETPLPKELPWHYVQRIARAKADKIAAQQPGSFIIAADTIACAGRRVIGKADTREAAEAILKLLSGRRHRVYSGVCVIAPDGRVAQKRICTQVTFKPLTHAELQAYLDSGQWEGKSGCYGIQTRAGGFVESINGSFSNVVGLPLVETLNMLRGLGWQA